MFQGNNVLGKSRIWMNLQWIQVNKRKRCILPLPYLKMKQDKSQGKDWIKNIILIYHIIYWILLYQSTTRHKRCFISGFITTFLSSQNTSQTLCFLSPRSSMRWNLKKKIPKKNSLKKLESCKIYPIFSNRFEALNF